MLRLRDVLKEISDYYVFTPIVEALTIHFSEEDKRAYFICIHFTYLRIDLFSCFIYYNVMWHFLSIYIHILYTRTFQLSLMQAYLHSYSSKLSKYFSLNSYLIHYKMYLHIYPYMIALSKTRKLKHFK